MAASRFQLVICDGPRCSVRGRPAALWQHAEALLAGEPDWQLSVASFSCLGRCPAGPNVLVRTLPAAADPSEAPGLFDLDGACHYWAVDHDLLERILRAHCEGRGALAGRHQRY